MSGGGRARWRRLRGRLTGPLVAVLTLLPRGLGWRGAQRLGAGMGRLAWWVARRDRRRTLEHLAIAFPELAERERTRLGRACFAHFGTTLLECLRLLGEGCEEVRRRVAVEGWEGVEALRASGRQILILTGHCGNWELLAATISCHGLPLSVVARRGQEERLDRLLVSLRQRFGTTTIARGEAGAARELLRTLRGGGALGMLIDQDTKVEGAWVPFFGRLAFTPLGAAQIGARRGVAVVPTFIERQGDGSHVATFHPPLELPENAVEATALMTRTIEEQVRRRPEQWVWMHRRWRRQPPASTTR
jgi:Kdo2-lipid IVA lauroyltransferase/acyltransferase